MIFLATVSTSGSLGSSRFKAVRALSNAVTMRSIASGSKDDPGINFLIGIEAAPYPEARVQYLRALTDVPRAPSTSSGLDNFATMFRVPVGTQRNVPMLA